MNKLLKYIIIIVIIPTLLTSCFRSEQLNERMLVQAIGVDLIDGVIEITLQVYAPATQGGSGISATPDNAKIVKAKGTTITQAIQNATLTQGKTVFMGHNRIIVLGSDLAKDGIIATLDYFSSNATTRHNINVVIAEEKASDILTAKINQGIVPAETLEKMVKRAYELGLLKNVKLYELLSTLQNNYESATLPIISTIDENKVQTVNAEAEGEGEETSTSSESSNELDSISNIEVKGTAIITEGKYVNTLSIENSRGLLFILNEIKDTNFTVESEDFSSAAVKIHSSKSELTPTIENGKIHFDLKITSQASLGQRELKGNVDATIDSIAQLELATAKLIEQECMEAYNKAVKESNSDIFNFGDIIWKSNPDIWKTTQNTWSDNVNEITFTVNSTVVINRVGLEL